MDASARYIGLATGLYPDRLHTMAEGNPVIVAVDGSEHSKKAFECKLYMITRLSFIIKTFVFQNALRKTREFNN